MARQVRRLIFFFLAILVGVAAGLGYGWAINPRETTETNPETLRADFRTDYVLMVSELYMDERDANMALERLSFLGNTPPLTLATSAIRYAESHQYGPADIRMMRNLASAVELSVQDND